MSLAERPATILEGGVPAPPSFASAPLSIRRLLIALLLLAALIGAAIWLSVTPGRGSAAGLAVLLGGLFGIVLQRGRFCFHCIFRDLARGDGRPALAIVTALAAGSLGYALVFGAFLPDAFAGRLPPDAHIGPVSWVLVLAAAVFGLGMLLSGSCLSGHLYRLGEGSGRAPFAIVGSVLGFGLGFATWNQLYLLAVSDAPSAWLPATLGYSGSIPLQLLVLAVLGYLAWRRRAPAPRRLPVTGLTDILERVLIERWGPLASGLAVAAIGVSAYLRIEPLGVTAEIGSLARTLAAGYGLLPQTLHGLDSFRGCATAVIETISQNGLFVVALIVGSLAAAIAAGQFKPVRPTVKNATTAFLGGLCLGWGSMTALGCTVGVLLSGVMAFAVSGWVFGVTVLITVLIGVRFVR